MEKFFENEWDKKREGKERSAQSTREEKNMRVV